MSETEKTGDEQEQPAPTETPTDTGADAAGENAGAADEKAADDTAKTDEPSG